VTKGKNNILMTIVLLIFWGHASASPVVSCSMMSQPMSHSDMQMMSDMVHPVDPSTIEVNQANAQSMTMMQDCCSDDGNCSMNGCLIVTVAVANEIPLQSESFIQNNISSDHTMAPRQFLSSPYRPPIVH